MKINTFYKIPFFSLFLILQGCTNSLSETAFLKKLPLYEQKDYEKSAEITFSSDKRYESRNGVPLDGEPVICTPTGLKTTKRDGTVLNPIIVPAETEIAVTSVINWYNAGWEKTCWPFVKFIPENGASYIVINERIGGKGVSSMWTGVGRQTCKVSVFKIDSEGFSRVKTENVKTSCNQ